MFEIEFPWYGETENCQVCGREIGIGTDQQLADIEKTYHVEV